MINLFSILLFYYLYYSFFFLYYHKFSLNRVLNFSGVFEIKYFSLILLNLMGFPIRIGFLVKVIVLINLVFYKYYVYCF